MDALNWRCGLGYDAIRKNRESLRDLKIQELLDSCCVFLKEYPDYIISEAGDIFSTLNRKVTKLSPGRKSSGYRFVGLRCGSGQPPSGGCELKQNIEWALPKENITSRLRAAVS